MFTGNAVALAVGVPLGTAAGHALGWRSAFVIAAGLTAAITVLALFALPPLTALPPATTGSKNRGVGPVRSALHRPGMRSVLAVTGLLVLGHYLFFSYITIYLDKLGVPVTATSAVLLGYGVAGIVGTLALGRAYDRRPRASFATVTTVLLAALASLAVLGSIRPTAGVTAAAIVSVTVLGAAAVALPIALQSMVLARTGPAAPDTASSLLITIFNLGISAGALIGGLVLAAIGVPALATTALLIAACGAILAVRTKGIPTASAGLGGHSSRT